MNEFDPDARRKGALTEQRTQAATFSAEREARAALEGGERLLWFGQPNAQKLFIAAFAIYFFAIPWTAFSLFWESMALTPLFSLFRGESHENVGAAFAIVFPLFGLPFIGIGFWMLSRPFAVLRTARRTVYMLTDKRAVIIAGGAGKDTVSTPFSAINEEMQVKEYEDGSGSILFAKKRQADGEGGMKWVPSGFEYIADVRKVEDKLMRAKEGVRG